MSTDHDNGEVVKLPTGIDTFDVIAKGGLPRNRTTLVSGTAGSGKTVFAVQFLAAGIRQGEAGVLVTFEESSADIRKNMRGFGWDLAQWESDGKLYIVDASPDPTIETIESGSFDLGALGLGHASKIRKYMELAKKGIVRSQRATQAVLRR